MKRVPPMIRIRISDCGTLLLLACALSTANELSKHSIPGRDHYRHVAKSLRLTREPYQRARLVSIDVTELRDLLPLEPGDFRQLLRAGKHAYPAGAASSRAALNRYRPFSRHAARVARVVVALIVGCCSRQVLGVDELELCRGVVLVEDDRENLVGIE